MEAASNTHDLILKSAPDEKLRKISEKVISKGRITFEEGLALYLEAPLSWLGMLAGERRRAFNGNTVWYNRNYHIEPTNRCVYNCRFCAYNSVNSGTIRDLSTDEIISLAKNAPAGITELHIVGGVAPGKGVTYYANMLARIHEVKPNIHLKAFSAIEISYMADHDNVSVEKALQILKDSGLNSIPGGGAEIFDSDIRKRICPEKDSANKWLEIHETAHNFHIPSNATMLYGHVENYTHRLDHLIKLRTLQERTGGFMAFIPLKFKNANNPMSDIPEVTVNEDLRNYAVSRIFLDNIPHIKAYWPMIGRYIAQMTLHFGVDDIDGTIEDSTTIYSYAGSEEQNPSMDENELKELISSAGFKPAERNSLYEPL